MSGNSLSWAGLLVGSLSHFCVARTYLFPLDRPQVLCFWSCFDCRFSLNIIPNANCHSPKLPFLSILFGCTSRRNPQHSSPWLLTSTILRLQQTTRRRLPCSTSAATAVALLIPSAICCVPAARTLPSLRFRTSRRALVAIVSSRDSFSRARMWGIEHRESARPTIRDSIVPKAN